MQHPFELSYLDHVAIRAKDMDVSIRWYENVMGMKKYQLEAWGPFPIFMLSGKSGVAIFPAQLTDPEIPASKNIKIDHFAFNVTNTHFDNAQAHFKANNIPFEFQDHTYFHSIYLKDPDGHTVELTTLVVPEEDFFK